MSLSCRTALTLGVLLLVGCPKEIPIPFEPPELRTDYAQTALDTPVTLAPLLNDFDPNGEVLTVLSITTPSNGTATLNPDGTVLYTPNLGFLGGDSFTVTITDATGNEGTTGAYVTVGSSLRTVFRSNYTDYFTYQLYMSDDQHPGVMIPLNTRVQETEGPAISRQQVAAYVPSTDGVNMVYLADTDQTRLVTNLWHVDLRRPWVQTQLTDVGDGQAIGGVSLPQLSPDGLYAYYMSNELAFSTARPNQFDIIRVEVANPANKIRINTPLGTGMLDGEVVDDFIEKFSLSPDGAYLLYVVRNADFTPTLARNELRVVDLTTPEVSTVISGTPTAGSLGVAGSLSALGFRFVPGTDQVVYAAQENGLTTIDLYLVDYVAQTAPQKLSGNCIGTGVINYGFTPDGSRIIYVSTEDVTTVTDLYMVSTASPGTSTRLSELRTGTSAVASFSISFDNTYVVYIRDDDTEDQRELYFVEFANPTVQVKLNHMLRPETTEVAAEVVLALRMSQGAPREVLYSTNDEPVDGIVHQTLRTVNVDVPGVTSVVGPSIFFSHTYGWMADGETIVYQDSPPESISATSLYLVQRSAPTVFTRLTNEDHAGDVAVEFSFLP